MLFRSAAGQQTDAWRVAGRRGGRCEHRIHEWIAQEGHRPLQLSAEKGLNVTLIDVWKEHVDAINKDGLKMDGHGGDRIIKVNATSNPSSLDKMDAVIVMCKATALEPALNSIKNIIGEKTVFMSFQNGIGHEAIIQSIVGNEKVIGGKIGRAHV